MFTGLVRAVGRVRSLQEAPQARRVVVEAQLAEGDRILGASVCVSGVCLTVVDSGPDYFAADIGFETLDRSTLGKLQRGDGVNLEPSLRMGDPLGGHLVSGHVDGVGRLRSIEARGDARKLWFWVPEPLRRYIAEKGSICIDGVSLTVNEIDDEGFSVGIIPHTLAETTLGQRKVGDDVNLEVDLLARYVERLFTGTDAHAPKSEVSWSTLARAGFTGAPGGAKGRG